MRRPLSRPVKVKHEDDETMIITDRQWEKLAAKELAKVEKLAAKSEKMVEKLEKKLSKKVKKDNLTTVSDSETEEALSRPNTPVMEESNEHIDEVTPPVAKRNCRGN